MSKFQIETITEPIVKRGPRPHSDATYIAIATAGKAKGDFSNANEAARFIAKAHCNNNVTYDTLYRRLRGKLKPLFSE